MKYKRSGDTSVARTVGSDQRIQCKGTDDARLPFVNSLPFDLGGWYRFFYDLARVWGEDITFAPLRNLEYVHLLNGSDAYLASNSKDCVFSCRTST